MGLFSLHDFLIQFLMISFYVYITYICIYISIYIYNYI